MRVGSLFLGAQVVWQGLLVAGEILSSDRLSGHRGQRVDRI